MYLTIFLAITAVIAALLVATFLYAKNKEKKLKQVNEEVEYYKTTDSRCLNCAYNTNIRNNHVCVSKLTPKTEECENTYKEKGEEGELVKTDAQTALEVLTDYFLGTEWRGKETKSVKELNTMAMVEIMTQYISKNNNNIDMRKTRFSDFVSKDKEKDSKEEKEEKKEDKKENKDIIDIKAKSKNA